MSDQNSEIKIYLTTEQENQFIDLLIADEGLKPFCYDDATGKRVYAPKGKITIAIGINLDEGLTRDECIMLCRGRVKILQRSFAQLPFYRGLDIVRKLVVLSMAYNMGVGGLMEFKDLIKALTVYNWNQAADEILDSKAARDLPARYKRLSEMMRTGTMKK